MATLIINTGEKAFSREPALEGVGEALNKIWSKNTGRTSTGKMTGDIVTKKKKLSVKYPPLTESEKVALEEACDDAFFQVTYKGKKYTMYCDSISGTLYSMVAGLGFRYTNCTVNLIEQ